jgi:DNA-binding transcriptional MerR regulator
MMGMAIGGLARATGTKAETIRYYERIGLLPKPSRTAANYRSYGTAELARLSFVRRARALGFSIDQVSALLELADCRERSCEAVDTLAQQHLVAIDAKIADLTALRRELADLIGQCRKGSIAECRILDALAPPIPAL